MRRLHLWEWGDQRWLPAPLRRWLRESTVEAGAGPYAAAAPLLAWWLARCGCASVVDLCSGTGGPWAGLVPALTRQGVRVDVLLTDLQPPPDARPCEGIRSHPSPVDARRVPGELLGCRTMFTALHHFRPGEVREILRGAATAGVPFAAFEWTQRTPARAAEMLLSPLAVWRDALRAAEPGAARRFWTFVVPLVPALHGWDAVMSHLRSYTADELRALAADAGAPGYAWEAGTLGEPGAPGTLVYLLGVSAGGAGENAGGCAASARG
jgi:hypothetical protein